MLILTSSELALGEDTGSSGERVGENIVSVGCIGIRVGPGIDVSEIELCPGV